MIKFSATQDWNFDMAPVAILEGSGALEKRASTQGLLKFARTPGQTDLHIIAVGAYEGTGFNRNGDMFKEAECINNHHYFKDAGRAVHRHHKNKPNDPKYGVIKAAAYNRAMKRIELVVGLDNEKCADIIEEQSRKGNTNWSMASKQAVDRCTWCGHEAKTDDDRCEHIPANIGELNKKGELCGMENPDPRWFEISYVHRPADRIGMSLKMASDSLRPLLPKDHLSIYTGFVPPENEFMISKRASDKRHLLTKLAAMEKHLDAVAESKGKSGGKDLYLARQAGKINKGPKIKGEKMDGLRKQKPKDTFKATADKGVIMGPEEFSNYAFGDRVKPEAIEGMKTHLPDVYQQLAGDQQAANTAVNDEKFDPSGGQGIPPELQELVNSLLGDHSLLGEHASNRVLKITIEVGGKGGSDDGGALKKTPKPEERSKEAFDKELAKVYATYKLAALNYLDEQGKLDDELVWNALIQNRG